MSKRTLLGIWKANHPQWIWACLPFWAGSLLFASGGVSPDRGILALFIAAVVTLQATAEFANTYVDRYEDRVHFPANPLVPGELGPAAARKALLLECSAAGLLLLALLLVSLNYYLVLAMLAAWAIGMAYSLPPLRLKKTAAGPLSFALSTAAIPIAASLVFGMPGMFMIAFALFLLIGTMGANLSTGQIRKTLESLVRSKKAPDRDVNIYELSTHKLGISIRTAVALEILAGLAALILVAGFWYAGVFDRALTIALFSSTLPFLAMTAVCRLRNPLKNFQRCVEFAGISALLIMLSYFSLSLTGVLQWHWYLAALASAAFLAGFFLLLKHVHPYGPVYSPRSDLMPGRLK
ncbi:MAG: UbiA family prenyltransferase [Dehalococcoidia bacterium]|nr:UbiA family prenyltransferase [Dehalococcoidia bacterium]